MNQNKIHKTIWKVYTKKTDDIIDQLLYNRGIGLKDKEIFFKPNFQKDMLDPDKINNMFKAVKIIKSIYEKNEKIGIFADYDADGIPGAAILYKSFKLLNIDCHTYIPSRSEGYGLNKKGIDELFKKGCKLIVTVDLGICCKKEVEYAKKIGLKIIITDHHEIKKELFPSDADAILHTHLSKAYTNKDLAGGAVAFKLACAIGKKFGIPNERDLKWLLDLAAISTICDVVPLLGENRIIAKYGLIVLSKTKNIGLRKIYEIANIDFDDIDTYKVGFLIGPRINAPSRMHYSNYSYQLLTIEDSDEAKIIANKLNDINIKRQKTLEDAISDAQNIIKKEKIDKNKIIILKNKNWSLGIIGLISSRITELYNRPSIIFTTEDGKLRGSARSQDYFNLIKLFTLFKKYLISYGGHKFAAGISVKETNFRKFESEVICFCNKKIKDSDLIKKIKIDYELNYEQINRKLVNEIKLFEPFGIGNSRPVFMLRNAQIVDLKWIGKEKNHLKFCISLSNFYQTFDAIKFNSSEYKEIIYKNDIIDLVFSLEENIWKGNSKIQLKIIDIKKLNEKK